MNKFNRLRHTLPRNAYIDVYPLEYIEINRLIKSNKNELDSDKQINDYDNLCHHMDTSHNKIIELLNVMQGTIAINNNNLDGKLLEYHNASVNSFALLNLDIVEIKDHHKIIKSDIEIMKNDISEIKKLELDSLNKQDIIIKNLETINNLLGLVLSIDKDNVDMREIKTEIHNLRTTFELLDFDIGTQYENIKEMLKSNTFSLEAETHKSKTIIQNREYANTFVPSSLEVEEIKSDLCQLNNEIAELKKSSPVQHPKRVERSNLKNENSEIQNNNPKTKKHSKPKHTTGNFDCNFNLISYQKK